MRGRYARRRLAGVLVFGLCARDARGVSVTRSTGCVPVAGRFDAARSAGFRGRYARRVRDDVRLGVCRVLSAFHRTVSKSRCARRPPAGSAARRGLGSGGSSSRRRGSRAAFAAGHGCGRLVAVFRSATFPASPARLSAPPAATCRSGGGLSNRAAVGLALHFVKNLRNAFGGLLVEPLVRRCRSARLWRPSAWQLPRGVSRQGLLGACVRASCSAPRPISIGGGPCRVRFRP